MSRFRLIFVLLALSVAGCASYPRCHVYKGTVTNMVFYDYTFKDMDTCPDVNWVNGFGNPVGLNERVCFVSRRNKNEQMFKSQPDLNQTAHDQDCAIYDATDSRDKRHWVW